MDARTSYTGSSDTPVSTDPNTAADRTPLEAVTPLDCSAVLTHHWLVRRRGGEKVLEALRELLPDAAIHTLVHDPRGFDSQAGAAPPPFQAWGAEAPPVKTSLLQRIPGAKRHYPKLLPLMPLAARRMKLPPVDLVVCSDAALAKAMTPAPRSKVVCYCHSPMRYAWEREILKDYCAAMRLATPTLTAWLMAYVRRADYRAAQRVDQFVANSRHVADRIRRHYNRNSLVVHPPVELPAEVARGPRADFYLCVGQHVAYKRLDLAVEACRQLGRALIVIGEGPEVTRLRTESNEHVTFFGYQPDPVVHDHYRRARGLIFAGEEDFGIVPVEAMARGCPVIAYGVGGATETVDDGHTGVWFEEQTVECVAAAIKRAETTAFDPAAMHARMQRFSRGRFLHAMRGVLEQALRA
jgi:glycosyltransferase involved in cell wall biosynthesis